MGVKRYITLPDGRRWMVSAHLDDIGNFTVQREGDMFSRGINTNAQVVVPMEGIYGMSDEEIGRHVREMTYHARACVAEHHAQRIVGGKRDLYRRWEELAAYVEHVRPLLKEFAEYIPPPTAAGQEATEIPHALHIISQWEQHVARKQKGKVAGRYERAAAAKDYDALFVAIGRRDGFKCAACGSVDNLQIDHIEPVTFGGETKPDNLQLLCPSCNSKKGERTIDYRGTLQADETQ